jgi:hypothetical protein
MSIITTTLLILGVSSSLTLGNEIPLSTHHTSDTKDHTVQVSGSFGSLADNPPF